MAVYEVQTDSGTYQVETEDAPQQAPAAVQQAQAYAQSGGKGALPAIPSHLPWALQKQEYDNSPVQGTPILPSVMAGAAAGMGALNTIGDKLGLNIADKARAKGGKVLGAPILPRPSGLLEAEGAEVPTVGRGLLNTINESIPSKTRAGATLNSVRQSAGSAPVDLSKAGDIALKMRNSINVTPPSVNRFLSRVTNPNLPNPTLDESMDMASDAGQTAFNDKLNMTANTRRQLKDFRKAIADANAEAAEKAGQGQPYQQGMKEYAQNAKIRKVASGVVGAGLLGPLYGKAKKYAGLLGVELP